VHRVTHADEDRPDRRRAAELVQQLIGDVPALKLGNINTLAGSFKALKG
jgi:hypothetical protein